MSFYDKTAVLKRLERMINWEDFYASRINSSYQSYFERRYREMLSYIVRMIPTAYTIREEGIGIGSMAKALMPLGFRRYHGFDNNYTMLQLAKQNWNSLEGRIYHDDILAPQQTVYADVVITHGVLEHFEDEEIKSIVSRYKQTTLGSLHYVPLDKYLEPSFGDERLMSKEKWIELTVPKFAKTFNDGHDLMLVL